MSFVIRKHDRFTNEAQDFQLVFYNNITGQKKNTDIDIDHCCGISGLGIFFIITNGILLLTEDDVQKVEVIVNNRPITIHDRQPEKFLNTIKMLASNYCTEQALEALNYV